MDEAIAPRAVKILFSANGVTSVVTTATMTMAEKSCATTEGAGSG